MVGFQSVVLSHFDYSVSQDIAYALGFLFVVVVVLVDCFREGVPFFTLFFGLSSTLNTEGSKTYNHCQKPLIKIPTHFTSNPMLPIPIRQYFTYFL